MISDEGVKVLMSAAGGGRLAKLEHLFLNGNNTIGEEGISAIVEAIDDDLPSLNMILVQSRTKLPRCSSGWFRRAVNHHPYIYLNT